MIHTINGVEINPEHTLNGQNTIYINEGTFESYEEIYKFPPTKIPIDCNEWLEKGTRVNVYYHPEYNRFTLSNENLQGPNQWGFHLGGVTLGIQENGSCIKQILLPDNGDVIHHKYFNYEYDEAYLHDYHLERPENTFDDGYDEGYQKVQELFG